jgi:hypothetical protein
MSLIRTWAFAALAAGAAFGGMYDRPWATIEAADRSEARQEFPPAITQVDGKSTRNPRESDPLEPGKHTVKIRFETGRVTQGPGDEVRDMELDLQPCTRYRIAARRTQGKEWEPQVYTEKIGECARKFK